jgi:hypothetical protein
MSDNLRNSQLRTFQYFYVDGSFEFGFGLLCLILAAFFFAERHVQGWLSAVVDSSLVLVLIGGAWLINRLIKLLKERITWPRTGYVTYNRREGSNRGRRLVSGLVIGGLVAALASILATSPNIRISMLPLLSGLLLGLVLMGFAWRTSIPRFYLLAFLSAVLGVILAYGRLEAIVALAYYYLVFGMVLFATGACVLRAYLHQNPAAQDTLK